MTWILLICMGMFFVYWTIERKKFKKEIIDWLQEALKSDMRLFCNKLMKKNKKGVEEVVDSFIESYKTSLLSLDTTMMKGHITNHFHMVKNTIQIATLCNYLDPSDELRSKMHEALNSKEANDQAVKCINARFGYDIIKCEPVIKTNGDFDVNLIFDFQREKHNNYE